MAWQNSTMKQVLCNTSLCPLIDICLRKIFCFLGSNYTGQASAGLAVEDGQVPADNSAAAAAAATDGSAKVVKDSLIPDMLPNGLPDQAAENTEAPSIVNGHGETEAAQTC